MKRWQNYVALFIACVALQGCADSSDDSTAGNDGAKLTLSKVTPANGSKGTVVALEGAKFEQGMECIDECPSRGASGQRLYRDSGNGEPRATTVS